MVPTILAPAKLTPPVRPEVRWWPRCSICGAQAAVVGRQVFWRVTSAEEWLPIEPACTRSLKGGAR